MPQENLQPDSVLEPTPRQRKLWPWIVLAVVITAVIVGSIVWFQVSNSQAKFVSYQQDQINSCEYLLAMEKGLLTECREKLEEAKISSEDEVTEVGGLRPCKADNDCQSGYQCNLSLRCSLTRDGKECRKIGDGKCHQLCQNDEGCPFGQSCQSYPVWQGDVGSEVMLCGYDKAYVFLRKIILEVSTDFVIKDAVFKWKDCDEYKEELILSDDSTIDVLKCANLKTLDIDGYQIIADESAFEGVNIYGILKEEGFEKSFVNKVDGTISGISGYQRDNLVCQVINKYKGGKDDIYRKLLSSQGSDLKRSITIKCGILTE